jgi:hypothetical protein
MNPCALQIMKSPSQWPAPTSETATGGGLRRAGQETRARSVADLQAAINRFLADHNEHSKPFEWVADPDKIIAAVRRGHQVLDSIR